MKKNNEKDQACIAFAVWSATILFMGAFATAPGVSRLGFAAITLAGAAVMMVCAKIFDKYEIKLKRKEEEP